MQIWKDKLFSGEWFIKTFFVILAIHFVTGFHSFSLSEWFTPSLFLAILYTIFIGAFVRITTTEVYLEYGFLIKRRVEWANVQNFLLFPSTLVLYLNDNSVINIRIGFLRQEKNFEEFIQTKLRDRSQEPIDCLYCGATIAAEDTKCQQCGWTWEKKF